MLPPVLSVSPQESWINSPGRAQSSGETAGSIRFASCADTSTMSAPKESEGRICYEPAPSGVGPYSVMWFSNARRISSTHPPPRWRSAIISISPIGVSGRFCRNQSFSRKILDKMIEKFERFKNRCFIGLFGSGFSGLGDRLPGVESFHHSDCLYPGSPGNSSRPWRRRAGQTDPPADPAGRSRRQPQDAGAFRPGRKAGQSMSWNRN